MSCIRDTRRQRRGPIFPPAVPLHCLRICVHLRNHRNNDVTRPPVNCFDPELYLKSHCRCANVSCQTFPLPMCTSSLPPSYDSSPAPLYSAEPRSTERRIHFRPRAVGLRANRDGIYVQKLNDLTLVLNGQEKNATRPAYGRSGLVSGSLHIDSSQSISAVTIKVCHTHISLSGSSNHSSIAYWPAGIFNYFRWLPRSQYLRRDPYPLRKQC